MAGVNQVKLSDVTCNETNMMISGVSSMDATITGDQIHLVNTGSGNTTIHFKGCEGGDRKQWRRSPRRRGGLQNTTRSQ